MEVQLDVANKDITEVNINNVTVGTRGVIESPLNFKPRFVNTSYSAELNFGMRFHYKKPFYKTITGNMSSKYFSVFVLALMNIVVYRAIFKELLKDVSSIRNYLKRGKLVKGTIVGYTTDLDLDQHKMHAPIVEFLAEDGSLKYEIKSDDFSFTKKRLNLSVDVCYKPEAPYDAIINPHKNLTLKIMLMVLVILLMIVLNVGIIFRVFF